MGDFVQNICCAYVPGQIIADRFVVEKHLASRQLHETYLVGRVNLTPSKFKSQETLEKLVLKSLDAAFLPAPTGFRERLRRRQVSGFDKLNGRSFIIRPYVEGSTLSDLLRFYGEGLPFIDLVYLLESVAYLLEGMHQRGAVHANIKPSNVLILPNPTKDSYRKNLALLDPALGGWLGHSIAKRVSNPPLDYHVAPEEFASRKVRQPTFSDDIFSFGLLAFELATGRPGWGENSLAYSALLGWRGGPGLYPNHYRKISHTFDSLINRCVKQAPEDRYRNMDVLLRDVEYEISVAWQEKELESSETSFLDRAQKHEH